MTAAPALRPFALPPFEGRLAPGGLSLRAARWGKRPTVAVSIVFPAAGSVADPPGLFGLSEVVADSFLGGTRRRNAKALADAIDDLALVVDVSAGFDASIVRLFALEPDLPEALALLAEVLDEPAFDENEIEKSRRRHLDALVEQRTEPDFLARERLLERLYPGHPYGRLAATEEGLTALTREDVVRFFETRFALSSATAVLVGSSEPGRLLDEAERALTGVTRSAPPFFVPRPEPVRGLSLHVVDRPGAVQTNLLFARPAILRSDPDWIPALVSNQSLGAGPSSRLFHVLREEKGLTYAAFSSLTARLGAGHFAASIDCRTEVTGEALSGLLGVLGQFASEGPSAAEHDRSRQFLAGSFALAHETSGALAQEEASRVLHALPEDEASRFRDRVAAVSFGEARAVAARYFAPAEGVVVAVGETAKVRPVLEELGPTTVWPYGAK